MKAGVYYNNNDVRVEERKKPEVDAGSVILKVDSCGICGSDVLEWYRIKKAPIVLGHELAGEIVEAGADVKGIKPGDRVFATHHVNCGSCRECRDGHETCCEAFHSENNFTPGGFAQYLKVSGRSVKNGILKLPDNVSFEEATFIEPLGTVVRCLRASGMKKGDVVMVIGSGITGVLTIMAAKILGAGRVMASDIREFRMKAALEAGADRVFSALSDAAVEIRKANDGRLADRVILCAGALQAAQQAFDCVERGGSIVFFAVPKQGETVPVDFTPLWRNDITVRTSYGAAPEDNRRALELIADGVINVKKIITHRMPLSRIAEGFALTAGGGESLKIIIKPNEI